MAMATSGAIPVARSEARARTALLLLHGRTMNPRDEIVEEIVLVGIGGLSCVFRLKRIHGHHRPSNRRRDVGRVDETERIEAVESAVVESRGKWFGFDDR